MKKNDSDQVLLSKLAPGGASIHIKPGQSACAVFEKFLGTMIPNGSDRKRLQEHLGSRLMVRAQA